MALEKLGTVTDAIQACSLVRSPNENCLRGSTRHGDTGCSAVGVDSSSTNKTFNVVAVPDRDRQWFEYDRSKALASLFN
jgi:hypothetical protein